MDKTNNTDKQEELSNIDGLLRKKFGSAFYGNTPPALERLSTGILGLDYILGGGVPYGRFMELSSLASCGKTTTAIHIAKQFQAAGHSIGYLDLERTLDKERALDLGVREEGFYYFRPSDGEQTIEMVLDLAGLGVKFIVIDSVPFLLPKSDMESEVGKISISPQARLISREQSKLVAAVEQSQCTVLFINQLRTKIGSYTGGLDTTGGNALKYLCSIRVQIYRKESASDGTGMKLNFKTTKNKTYSEGKSCEVDFIYETGLQAESSWRDILVQEGLIIRAGSYYKFPPELAKELDLPEMLGQGHKGCLEFIKNNKEVYNLLSERVLKTLTDRH